MTDLLWVDTICIEQQNARERAQQVSMMGWIYGAAEEVIVWLGKDETDVEELRRAIGDLLPLVREDPMKFVKPGLLFDNETNDG
jgi:hypothetical protein